MDEYIEYIKRLHMYNSTHQIIWTNHFTTTTTTTTTTTAAAAAATATTTTSV